jgi:hypothetical protein
MDPKTQKTLTLMDVLTCARGLLPDANESTHPLTDVAWRDGYERALSELVTRLSTDYVGATHAFASLRDGSLTLRFEVKP